MITDSEPARHAPPGESSSQARQAAEILGAHRITLSWRDRMNQDTVPTRLEVAAFSGPIALYFAKVFPGVG